MACYAAWKECFIAEDPCVSSAVKEKMTGFLYVLPAFSFDSGQLFIPLNTFVSMWHKDVFFCRIYFISVQT